MLYLMLNESRGMKLAKVGVTRNAVNVRRAQYRSHNPTAIMRSSCAGTESQESHCHSVLRSIGKGMGNEWVAVPDNVFNELVEKGMAYFYPNKKPIHMLEKW